MLDTRIYFFAGLAGVFSEAFIFSKGEWDRHGPTILQLSMAAQAAILGILITSGYSLLSSIKHTCLLSVIYLTYLLIAVGFYRLFLHRLRFFPGPLAARLSSFWILKENIPGLDFYKRLRELHDEFGDFVRIRPREISVCHPDAVADIHGSRSKILKGEFYEHMFPHQNIQLTRDIGFHKTKRRIWDKAFSPAALREYEPLVTQHYSELLEIIEEHSKSGSPADITKLFMDVEFDIISDLTFGKSWEMLRTGTPHPIIKEFIENKRAVGFVILVMWLFHLTRLFPGVESMLDDLMKQYGKELDERKQMLKTSSDFYTHFSQAENFDKDGAFDAQLSIVAGADTTAIAIINIFSFLAKSPEYQAKLHAELDPLYQSSQDDNINVQLLASKPYLTGIINETLRLNPPVPSSLQRLTPPEGSVIAGRYIPGNTNVSIPTHALHRDARAFVRPNEFIPERWSTQPELILRKDAFIPFSYGPFNCVGRPLAMMQLRMLTAKITRRFEVRIPEGMERACWRFEEDQADCFVLDVRSLPLCFKERVTE